MVLMETLITVLIIYCLVMTAIVSYLYATLKSVANQVYELPTIEQIAQKVMETKVPIIMGPDGPMVGLPGSKQTKQSERPSMVG